MTKDTSERKSEHVEIALKEDVEFRHSVWEDIEILHECLPELDLREVDPSVSFLKWHFKYPFIISALTGGWSGAEEINRVLALVAKHFSIGLETGSLRPLLESDEYEKTYRIPKLISPDVPLFLNIGAVQVTTENPARIKRIVEKMEADALVVHLNFLQEAVMIEGEPFAKGCFSAIERLISVLPVPVIVKETGSGISKETAAKLKSIGVSAIDVGGKGGTSMALIEKKRAELRNNKTYQRLCQTFAFWGIPTPISIIEVKDLGIPIIGSGGIRTGLDAAKAIALGADLVGMARPLLLSAVNGVEQTIEFLENFFLELKVAMFLTGSKTCADLKEKKLIITGRTREWLLKVKI
ncbi:MAG: type 2 isopentenyl-diphosphate Delta-isomerase [Desulfobacterota bacterium]|nr:type 2 isopentenyl-diphosphate Delta-isomerase [Thermodesulfobacteriota bacterium]MDW8001867.1 type 2 isopentenyl-diphosphate Delta-isomerase [Deltaproteobacteria bacterium]